MNISLLHITNNYPTSNFPIYGIFVKEQIDSLAIYGIKSTVFFINGKEKGKIEYIRSYFRLVKFLLKNKFDIIHCHHIYSGILFMLTGFVFFNKSIISYQNPPENEGGKFIFKIISMVFDKIIVKDKPRYSKKNKIIYLPNGVDLNLFIPINKDIARRQLSLDYDKKYILFFDSNNKKRNQKRIDKFLEIIKTLKNDNFSNIEPIILTNTQRFKIPLYLSAADLYLLTSDFEGSPNAVKECMACNLNVVTTPVGNVEELLSDVEGMYIANTFDISELVVLTKKALLNNKCNGRIKIIEKNLDINSVANKLFNIYRSMLF